MWSWQVLWMPSHSGPTSAMLYDTCSCLKWTRCTDTGEFIPMHHYAVGASKGSPRRGTQPTMDENEIVRVESSLGPHKVRCITTDCKEGGT